VITKCDFGAKMHNNPPLARAAEGCALDTIEEAYTVRMTDFF